MLRLTNPTVFVTRPAQGSQEFVAALRDVAGPFVAVVHPAFELEAVSGNVPDFDAAIFSSRAGVAFAPEGGGRMAWCVGEATAMAARAKGYDALSADGNALDLVALILERKPKGKLVHLRAEIVRENIMAHLLKAGVPCLEVVVYRKAVSALTPETGKLISETQDVIIPAFSAETVSILGGWGISLKAIHVVAMSDHVAVAAREEGAVSVYVSARPDLGEMVALTARLIA